jgi:hypothetical protein
VPPRRIAGQLYFYVVKNMPWRCSSWWIYSFKHTGTCTNIRKKNTVGYHSVLLVRLLSILILAFPRLSDNIKNCHLLIWIS